MSPTASLTWKAEESLKIELCILLSCSSKHWLSVCKSRTSTTAKELSITGVGGANEKISN